MDLAAGVCGKPGSGDCWQTQRRKKPKTTSTDLRRRNLMVFHAPESLDPNPQGRCEHDVNVLQTLFDKLLDVGEDELKIKQIACLGKKIVWKVLPMRVTFAD